MLLGTAGNPEGTRLRIFLANAGHGGIRGCLLALNTLVLVPLILASLGKEQFALLALVTPFLRYGFNGVLDCGIATGVIRHTSQSFAAAEIERTNEYVSSGVALYFVLSTVLLCGYYLLGSALMQVLLRRNTEPLSEARIVFGYAVWIYVLFSLSNSFFAVLMAVQKVQVTHWIGSASLLLELIGVLSLVPFGLTLQRIMLVYGANSILSLALAVFMARYYFPALRLHWRYVSMDRMREILRYGVQFSATSLTAVLSPIVDKFIVARFVGLNAVAVYEVASRLTDLLRRATQLLLLPLFPMSSAKKDGLPKTERRSFYVAVFSANLLVSCGLYLIPASLAYGIFQAWLGPQHYPVAPAFITFCVMAFSQAIIGPLTMILLGGGSLRPLMVTAISALFLNVAISPILAHFLGFAGVLVSAMVTYGGVSVGFLLWSLRIAEFAIPARRLLRLGAPAVLAGLLPGIVLTRALCLGEQSVGWPKLLLAVTAATALFLLVSLAQSDVRRMTWRVFAQLRQTVVLAWTRSRLSNA